MNTENPQETKAKPITVIGMTDAEIEIAEKVAAEKGYKQTAYTSSSDLVGLTCLPERTFPKCGGTVVKTREWGFVFMQDCEDLHLNKDGTPWK